ncbi:hypothetical protein [Herbaspirillum sp. YR522]|uniref:hypothetical protein n=1 Tax=Herbaspirillum sp. YR522 TaxID=1144342 RepID=UPI0012F7CD28|nr:hypothetical protein [Herbaspirillum sp. YR522]
MTALDKGRIAMVQMPCCDAKTGAKAVHAITAAHRFRTGFAADEQGPKNIQVYFDIVSIRDI